MFNARTAIIPELKKDNIRFKIEINSEGTLVEQQGDIDTSKPAVITIIEKNLEKIIKKEVENTIDIVQKNTNQMFLVLGVFLIKNTLKTGKKLRKIGMKYFPR